MSGQKLLIIKTIQIILAKFGFDMWCKTHIK